MRREYWILLSAVIAVFYSNIVLSCRSLKVSVSGPEYVHNIERYVKMNLERKIVLANMVDCTEKNEKTNWKIFPDAKALEQAVEKSNGTLCESAHVWKKNNRVVRVTDFYYSPSGDWNLTTDSFYRQDGTLVRLKSILRTFHTSHDSPVAVERDGYFNQTGELVKETKYVSDLSKPKIEDNSIEYMDVDVTVVKKVRQWPFWALVER